MANDRSSMDRIAIWPLIRVPAIITLAITLLRLVGELEHWSRMYFGQPGGDSALVGITWLAPLFGIYFAIKLVRAGQGPASTGRSLGFSVLAALVALTGMTLGNRLPFGSFHQFLIYVWALAVVAAIITVPGWRDLVKVQLAYAYAARIPTAIIMFFAIRGSWGTHYDFSPPNLTFLNYFTKYVWIGFFAQLVFWVGYTVVSGMLAGAITAAVMRAVGRAPQPTQAARTA